MKLMRFHSTPTRSLSKPMWLRAFLYFDKSAERVDPQAPQLAKTKRRRRKCFFRPPSYTQIPHTYAPTSHKSCLLTIPGRQFDTRMPINSPHLIQLEILQQMFNLPPVD